MKSIVIALSLLLPAAVAGARIELAAGGGTADSGPASQVSLGEPFGVALDGNGNWYVCEYKAHRITKVDPKGNATRFAGTGVAGYSGDGGPAIQAQLRQPHELIVGPGGQMYVADTYNHRVRRIDLRSGVITTLAGTGEETFSGDGGPASQAAIKEAYAVALGPGARELFIVDLGNRRVRAVNLKAGTIRTVAGNGQSAVPPDGSLAAESPLVEPRAITVDQKGNLYILERRGNALRVVDPQGRIRTLISPGMFQPDLNGPKHLSMDRQGRLLITDTENHLIRRYDPKHKTLTTLVGTGEKGGALVSEDPLRTQLARPHGVFVDPKGAMWISDSENNRVLRLIE
jgi:sugar lactone lactonase YvrE